MAATRHGASSLVKVPWLRIMAEFLVIFAGVTLSLIADDWRQDRNDRRLEGEILQEVSADLAKDAERLDVVNERLTDFDATIVWLWQHLDRSDVAEDEVIGRFRGLFDYTHYQPVTAAYVTLKAGGQMTLIRDHEIRRKIVDYYEVGQSRMVDHDERTWGVYSDLRLVFHRHFGWRIPESSDSFSADTPFGFLTSWAAFRTDPQTVSVLGRMAPDVMAWAKEIEELKRDNSALREAILSWVSEK